MQLGSRERQHDWNWSVSWKDLFERLALFLREVGCEHARWLRWRP